MGKIVYDSESSWHVVEAISSFFPFDKDETCFQSTNETIVTSSLSISNPDVPLPNGLYYQNDFVNVDEELRLIEEIHQREFLWEGFDQRRRVQRYHLESSIEEDVQNDADTTKDHYKSRKDIPNSILDLHKRLTLITGYQAHCVSVEEYSIDKMQRSGEFASNHTVTTFESVSGFPSSCSSPCPWFTAQVTLHTEAYQHCNQPSKRNPNCWTLKSEKHWTNIRMEQRSLFIKTDTFLSNWRSRVAASNTGISMTEDVSSSYYNESDVPPSCAIVVKFYRLPTEESNDFSAGVDGADDDDDKFGYRSRGSQNIPSPNCPMPPLHELLTIVITTSPIRSNPSTEVVSRAMATFQHGGHDFAFKCRKIIVCDGCRVKTTNDSPDVHGHRKVSLRYANVKQSLRNGIVTPEQSEKYEQYKKNLKELCSNAKNDLDSSSPFQNTTVVELEERHGYGFALRHALRYFVETQFVCVVQHDRTFMRPAPVSETVHAMWRNPDIKYVGMSMRSNLFYRDIFSGKYGRSYLKDFDDTIRRVPELVVNSTLYGPLSESTKAMNIESSTLSGNINSLIETYKVSAQGEIPQTLSKGDGTNEYHTLGEGKHQIILVPTLFWYDNVHICDTAHYRDFIFNPVYKMVARGGFVEDKVSPVMKRTVERLGFKDGHSRFGCFLLDDASGMFFTGHLDGGSYLTSQAKQEILVAKLKTSNAN